MKRFLRMITYALSICILLTGCSAGSDSLDRPADSGKEEQGSYDGPEGTLAELMDKIYDVKPIELAVATSEIDLSNPDLLTYNTGLTDASMIESAVVSEAMISSQAYSCVLVKVKDKSDAQTVADEMLNGINPGKWICVTADDLKVAGCNDTILLIMVSSSLESVTADDIVDAFRTVCDGNQDFLLQ